MTDYVKKFRNDSLTPEELEELRATLAGEDDSVLGRRVAEDWEAASQGGELEGVQVGAGREAQVKGRIDRAMGRWRGLTWGVRVWRVASAAAVVLLPLLAVACIYLFTELGRYGAMPDDTLTFVTHNNEHSELLLPDSTRVVINKNSAVTYSGAGYNGERRRIAFAGEGFFDVRSDAAHPFTVEAPGLSVTVKGTRFNLEAREEAAQARLFLEEGLVEMRSELSGTAVEVHPGECATLTYSDGSISVEECEHTDGVLAWMHGGMVFADCSLGEVLGALGMHYGCRLTVNEGNLRKVSFTGTLPHDDLATAVAILNKIFGVQIVRE